VILVDTGPLVALTDRSDPWHSKCRDAAVLINDRLVTVWPAITEAMYLLRKSITVCETLLGWLESDRLGISPLNAPDVPRIRELMRKYRDLPMDLADAALVRVAERERIRRIFTVDRRDFEIYRPYRLGRFDVIP